MHFALRGYLFVALIALLGVAGTWSEEPAFAGAWLLPAFLLLAGLAFEAWYLRGTRVTCACASTSGSSSAGRRRARSRSRTTAAASSTLQYARVLPAGAAPDRGRAARGAAARGRDCSIPRSCCRCGSAPADSAPCRRGC